MATEPQTEIVGFTTQLSRLDISPRRRLDDVVKYTAQLPMGGTDCAAPMIWAIQQRLDFDTIVVYTDSETWYGGIHPHQALRRYRDQVGHDVRLVVVGLAANQFTIADPSDAGMLDIAGLDSAVPNLIADFSRGTV